MTLLAIDTSTRAMGLALYDGLRVGYECNWHSQNYHTVELAPAIRTALAQAGQTIEDVEAVAAALGPGSYTGLRIGLALAKGLAYSRRLPLITVPTLDVLAAGQPLEALPLAAVLQAGRGRLAVGMYKVKDSSWVQAGPAELSSLEALSESIKEPTIICGELGEEERRVLSRKHKNALLASPAQCVRRPAVLAELAWAMWQAGVGEMKPGLGPIYLKSSAAVPA